MRILDASAGTGNGLQGIPCELKGLKDLLQGEVLAVPEYDHLPRLLAQLALDEAQQMLLVHACAVMYMGVYLHHVHADDQLMTLAIGVSINE